MTRPITIAVRGWVEAKEISPVEFGRVLGYSYNHAYQMLRGDGEASLETLGRMAVAYGAEAVGEVLDLVEAERADAEAVVFTPPAPPEGGVGRGELE